MASDSHIVNNANYYGYNLQGKITRAHNAQSTLKQRFDKGGRLLHAEQVHNQQQAHTLKYSYDDYGRRQTLTLPDSSTLNYSYNKFGQLSAIHLQQANSKTNDSASAAKPLVTLSYDSQGNIQTQKFGNDITLNQQYDVFNRLTQQQLTHPAQRLFDTCTYNYDSINQLIARKNEGVSSHNTNFEYNSLGQLIQQTLAGEQNNKITQYQWDSFGNPQSQTVKSNTSDTDSSEKNTPNTDASSSIDLTRVTHSEYKELAPNSSESSSKNISNADSVVNNECTNNTTINSATDADRLTHFGYSDFYYDEFGNQIRETGKGIKTRREYNAFNQLSCFNNNGTLTQYDYDPLGRRIAKHTEHGKVDYIWDNDQLIGECQHGEYTWYINLPNQFHPVALIKNCEVYYYHLDQLNTPRFVTNNSAQVVWENQADVYGYEENEAESNFNTESSFTQPIRFQGQYLDEESGLHYNRYRYYSPKQQRFINQDPIGLVGGINHYQYAPNPVNWVDPFGLMCKEGEASLKEALNNCTQSGVISPELSEQLLQAAYDGQLTPKEIKGQLSQIPQEEGLKSVSILPIEWAVEGVADVADALIGMFDEGITAAGVATVAIAAIPGKLADKALEPVVKKLDNVIKLDPGKKGGWNKVLNGKLEPNTKYEVGNYTYATDELGRVNSVSGKLDLSKADRNTYQQTKAGKLDGIKDGLDKDEGGHLIASIFSGPGEQINYAAMDGNLNKGAWKSMENKWAKALASDPPKNVEVNIKAIYENDGKRPEAFEVEYTIDGELFENIFENQPGG